MPDHSPPNALPLDERGKELRAPEYSLRQLSYFLAAARHQSVQKAAEAVHVSAPAISAAIAHLEATLGTPLFMRRHARGLVLTEAGSVFAVECRDLLQDAWHLGAGRLVERGEVQGRLHLGCLFSFGPYIVPPLLRQLATRYPSVHLHWHEGHHEYLLEGLQTGAFDLVVTYDFDIPPGVESVPLRPAPLQAVLPGHHPLLRRERVTLQELATEPLILLDVPRTREYMLSAFGASGVTPHIVHRVLSLPMLQGLVSEGLGYSLLNFCPPYTHSRPLVCKLRDPNVVIAHSRRYRLTRSAAAVIECVTTLVDELAMSHD